jgi:hypothetical protein
MYWLRGLEPAKDTAGKSGWFCGRLAVVAGMTSRASSDEE